MKVAQITHRRGFERVLAIFSAFAVFMSLMVMFAPAALAHHPLISANQVCADGSVRISYESVSWKTDGTSGSGHNDIRIEVRVNDSGNWIEVGNGAYNAGNNYRFNGTFDAAPYTGDSIQVRARANGSWANGQGGGETAVTGAIVVNLTCTQTVTVTANPQVCAVNQQGVAQGAISFNIAPASGATVRVYTNSNFTGQVGGALDDDVVLNLSPGTYYWQATAANGFALNNPTSGQFTISPCTASAVVVGGDCAVNANGVPLGSVQVTINPTSGATVVISGPGGPYNFSGSGGSTELAPGSYAWQATPGSGFAMGGQSSGNFVIDPCEGSVSVSTDVCAVIDGPLGTVEVEIDPDSSAIVTVYSDAGMSNVVATFDGDGGTANLAPGLYYWSAAAGSGFALTGDTSGSFTIDPCMSSVTVVSGGCVIDANGAPLGSVQVAIDPNSGATVVLSGPGGPYNFSGDGGSMELAPGSYAWTASPGAGFTLGGETSGEFTIDPCDVSLLVVGGECEILDGPTGSVTAFIDTDLGATVTVYDDELNAVATFSGSGGTSPLSPGTYTWEATPGDGFDFPDGQQTSGQFTIDPCDSTVVVSHGNCVEGAATAFGSVTVTISPEEAATVTIFNSNSQEVAVMSGGTQALAAGSYTWQAESEPGFDVAGETSGNFTVVACPDEVLDEEIVNDDPEDEVRDLEVLPFTGIDTWRLFGASIVLLGSGWILIRSAGRREEG